MSENHISRKFKLLKKLIDEAAYNSTIDTVFNRSLSIIQIHQATEWILRMIIESSYIAAKQDKDRALESPFFRLAEFAKISVSRNEKACAIIDTYLPLMQRINESRNSIYHKAIVDVDASEYLGAIEEMVRELSEVVFNLRWADISLSSLIRREGWKKVAQDAENSLNENHLTKSVELSWQLVQEVLAEWAGIAAEIGGAWLKPQFPEDYQVIVDSLNPEEYARRYNDPEVKALALDMSRSVYLLHFLTDTLTMLNEQERIKYLKLANVVNMAQHEKGEGKVQPASAIEAVDFAIALTTKYEQLNSLSK